MTWFVFQKIKFWKPDGFLFESVTPSWQKPSFNLMTTTKQFQCDLAFVLSTSLEDEF